MDDAREPGARVVEGRPAPLGAYPHLRIAGRMVFVSGTSSRRPDNSIEGAMVGDDGALALDIGVQTSAVLRNIDTTLWSVGLGLGDVVDLTTFLVDMADFDGYNRAYAACFDETGPARTTVAVRALPHPHLLIEIKAVALLPDDASGPVSDQG